MTPGRRTRVAPPVALLALALAAGRSAPAHAQSASIAATADVSTTALSVVTVQQLAFGNVLPSTPVAVNPQTSTSAGLFEFHGNKNAQFQATFTTPTQLTTGVGGYNMPIAFGANSGCHLNRNAQANCTFFDPAAGLVARLRNQNPPNDTYFVWVGGTVSPTAGQQPGVYRGTIVVTAAYTGL